MTATETVTIPTYPARPVNGGPLEKALPKNGEWLWEPKYNGWRALVHVPTGTMFNRKGDLLSITPEFTKALKKLEQTIAGPEWLDCEALERRHNIGRGTLIVLDCPDSKEPYWARREWLYSLLPVASNNPVLMLDDTVCMPPLWKDTIEGWEHLKSLNKHVKCEFYEGLVAKRADSKYPRQLRSSEIEYPFWMKHRWAF